MVLKALKVAPLLLSGLNITLQQPKQLQNFDSTLPLGMNQTLDVDTIAIWQGLTNIYTRSIEEQIVNVPNGSLNYKVVNVDMIQQETIGNTVYNRTHYGSRVFNGSYYVINPYQLIMLQVTNTTNTVNSFNYILKNGISYTQTNLSGKKWTLNTKVYVARESTRLNEFYDLLDRDNALIPGTATTWTTQPYEMRNKLLNEVNTYLQDEQQTPGISAMIQNALLPLQNNNEISEYYNETNYIIFYTEETYEEQTFRNQNGTNSTFSNNCNLQLTQIQNIVNATDYEIVNVPELMFSILVMPFTFISTAFNLTLFPGTPYAVNVSNIFLVLIGILIFAIIIKLIMRFMK